MDSQESCDGCVFRLELSSASAGDKCDASDCCPRTTVTTGKDAEVGTVSVDVPEIGSQEVAGEWLIPNGECLLVSFGAYTVADKDGKAVVKERLAIVDAEGTSVAVNLPIAGPGVVVPPPAPSSSPRPRLSSSPRPCLSSSTRTLQRKPLPRSICRFPRWPCPFLPSQAGRFLRVSMPTASRPICLNCRRRTGRFRR